MKIYNLQFTIYNFILGFFLLLVTCYVLPANVSAEIGIKQPAVNAGVQAGAQSGAVLLGSIIKNVIAIIYVVAAIGVTIMFLWGAIEWIVSGGDKEKLAAARKRITTALIGLTLLALAFVILGVVSQITGINVLGEITIPSFKP